jgi:hypothetical protein
VARRYARSVRKRKNPDRTSRRPVVQDAASTRSGWSAHRSAVTTPAARHAAVVHPVPRATSCPAKVETRTAFAACRTTFVRWYPAGRSPQSAWSIAKESHVTGT